MSDFYTLALQEANQWFNVISCNNETFHVCTEFSTFKYACMCTVSNYKKSKQTFQLDTDTLHNSGFHFHYNHHYLVPTITQSNEGTVELLLCSCLL